jgi:hypothetical protein
VPSALASIADVRDARVRTTTVVGRGEKGCAVGASSDTPSYTQADRLLTAIEQLDRNVERIQRQLEAAGSFFRYAGFVVLYVALLIPYLAGITTLVRRAAS